MNAVNAIGTEPVLSHKFKSLHPDSKLHSRQSKANATASTPTDLIDPVHSLYPTIANPGDPVNLQGVALRALGNKAHKSSADYARLYKQGHETPSYSQIRSNDSRIIQAVVSSRLSSWQQPSTRSRYDKNVNEAYFSRRIPDREFQRNLRRANTAASAVRSKYVADSSTTTTPLGTPVVERQPNDPRSIR